MTSGISLPIAYPTVTRQTIGAVSSHSYQLSLTRGYGNRILAVITAPFHTTTSLNTANVHSRSTLSTYNTFLNNVAIKAQSGFDATKSGDFIIGNREYLDLVIPDQKRGDLFGWAALEGKGIQVKPGTVQVTKISGLAIKHLQKN